MTYNYDRIFECIIDSVVSNGSIAGRMSVVIDECAAQHPHADWDRMRQIDYEADASRVACWLRTAFPEGQPSAEYRGLWFGLFNPVRSNGRPSADAYSCASPAFESGSIDWACDIDRPHSGSYLNSVVLGEIYSVAYEAKGGLGNEAEYPLALAYGSIAARAALSDWVPPPQLSNLQGVAVGFDSGDALLLGSFIEGQFCADVRAA